MDISVTPSPLRGEVAAIPSKSDAHRKLVCAALADAPTELSLPKTSADIDATIECLRSLGAGIVRDGGKLTVEPIPRGGAETVGADVPVLDCGESGSTFRFLLPVTAAVRDAAAFTGRGRLPDRPIGELRGELARHGVEFGAERLPFTIKGRMTAGEYNIPGNVSSQYITGLLFALPLLRGDSEIKLLTRLESAQYVEMTLSALREFGVEVKETESGYGVPGGQTYRAPRGAVAVEGDWSNAAFFLAAGALGGPVTVTGLRRGSAQGDSAIADVLRKFGATVIEDGDTVTSARGALRGIELDVGEIPDLLPILAVVASFAAGETRFTNAARLRLKESDRLSSVAAMLRSLGGECEELPDGLIVRGAGLTARAGAEVGGAGDHRIVMAAAAAAAAASNEPGGDGKITCANAVTIRGADAVAKSYPGFFEDFQSLGGVCNAR